MSILRIFRRRSDDNLNWWHWRPACLIWKAASHQKKRGKVFVYTVAMAGRPTTFKLCPCCVAEDDRARTKDTAIFIDRQTSPVKRAILPNLTINPITKVQVRRDGVVG